MNRIEVWTFDDVSDIEFEINKYCSKNELNPISISVSYFPVKEWVVAVVVEPKGETNA